jgi:hypothetical protein
MYFETKNVGDKAIATKGRIWIVDWNGVQYDLPELQEEGLSPGESRPGLFNMYQLGSSRQLPGHGFLFFSRQSRIHPSRSLLRGRMMYPYQNRQLIDETG